MELYRKLRVLIHCVQLVLIIVLTGVLLTGCKDKPIIHEPDPKSRTVVSVMNDWRFIKPSGKLKNPESIEFDDAEWENINLPHTWNSEDGTDGGSNYYRGTCWYRKKLNIAEADATGKKIYIEFQGVCMKMTLYINGTEIGSHKGGYTTFRFDITDHVKIGEENVLAVSVSNESDRAIAPISGDFTFFGGIYRDVSIIYTENVHIDMMDNGSYGVYLTPENVSKKSADLNVATKIVNDSNETRSFSVRIALKHSDAFVQNEFEKQYMSDLMFNPEDMCGGGLVSAVERTYELAAGESLDISETLKVDEPHLWNGQKDPYRYQVNVSVSENGTVTDSVINYIGFRTYKVDKHNGFYLNGKSYPLRGVAMHQDYGTLGYATTQNKLTESFSLMYEVGANVVRLSHYPHNSYTYELCDKYGIAVYAEIPFVNTYGGSGTYENPDATLTEYIAVTRQQLTEMIKQQYNRSSIFFWGLYNESQKQSHTVMVPLISELNDLAHELDSSRLTVTATFSEEGELLKSDILAWNTYPSAGKLKEKAQGFYEAMSGGSITAESERHSQWFIKEFADAGYYDGLLDRPIMLSEYGIGGSIYQHSDDYKWISGTIKIQTEEYQAYSHETWLHQMPEMKYLWGTFVWNMFDFSADNRVCSKTVINFV